MTRALCIPFHRYHPHTTQHYRAWMESLLRGLSIWKHEFDKLYLIDDYWDFNFEELDRLNKLGINYEIIKKQRDGQHWVQFHTAFPRIKEDYCLFLDNDVVIWEKGVVDKWFKKAEEGCFVTALDGSGGLNEEMNESFPILGGASRMGSYYFILNKEQRNLAFNTDLAPVHYKIGTFIPEIGYTTVEGDWQDSFGMFTYKILPTISKIYIVEDDRSSIYLEGDKITKSSGTPRKLGYYHVRNGGHTTHLLASKYSGDIDSYKHSIEITPQRELLRIAAWHLSADPLQAGDFGEVLKDINVPKELFAVYFKEFGEYHGL